MKTYRVNIDMKYSHEYIVTAKSKKEARERSWQKFAKRLPKKIFTIYEDEV